MKKYLLHPGYVTSATDGDKHYITASQLMRLYNVREEECVTYLPYRPYPNQEKLIDLYPKYDGKYTDMSKRQEEER